MQTVATTYPTGDASSVTTDEKLGAITATLEYLYERIHTLQAEVAALDKAGICTGVVHWRDANVDGCTAKLYANHSTNEACPFHGAPKPRGRLRVYVGADPWEQQKVLKAMERRRRQMELESEIRAAEARIGRIESAITTAWHTATGQQRWER